LRLATSCALSELLLQTVASLLQSRVLSKFAKGAFSNRNVGQSSSDYGGISIDDKSPMLVLEALADEVFAPRQQRYQLDREIGDDEGSQRDRRYPQERIPEPGSQFGMNRVEYDDVRQIHAIAHA
jgi:hypothetical protein